MMTNIAFAEETKLQIKDVFQNRRYHEKWLKNVFPAGFAPPSDAHGVKPQKHRQASEPREYIPIIPDKRPGSSTLSKTVGSVSGVIPAPILDGIDEFRHVAGPFFKTIDFRMTDDDTETNRQTATRVVNMDSMLNLQSMVFCCSCVKLYCLNGWYFFMCIYIL